MFSGIVLNVKV